MAGLEQQKGHYMLEILFLTFLAGEGGVGAWCYGDAVGVSRSVL